MSQHPLNLALRFLLELAALVIVGRWGWGQTEGWLRFVLAIGLPLLAAALWATFRVPNDPGPAPVAVPGYIRLVYELGLFALCTAALFELGAAGAGWAFGLIVLLHYLSSYDRVVWMLGSRSA